MSLLLNREPNYEAPAIAVFEPDPLEFFLQANVPTTRLIEHGCVALLDLYRWTDSGIAVCYMKDGEIVSERVTRIGLIEIGFRLGWTPQQPTECFGFDETVFYDQTGRNPTTWLCAENCYDEKTHAPLVLSPSVLGRLRKKAEIEANRAARCLKEEREARYAREAAERTECVVKLLAQRGVREGHYADIEEALPHCREAWEAAKVSTFGPGHGV